MSQIGQGSLNTKSAVNIQGGPVRALPPSELKKMQNCDVPGPGTYSLDNLNGWFKRSYNMNFSEIWKTHTQMHLISFFPIKNMKDKVSLFIKEI